MTVRIIGGGITGLVAAWRLKTRGIPFELLEASSRVGGVIRTKQKDGFLLESGPNTILETSQDITTLIAEVGLTDRVVYPSPIARKRFIVNEGLLEALPSGPVTFARSPLLSSRGKLRVMAEPFVLARSERPEESIAEFVERRFGRELLDGIIDPFMAGVYAGNPADLSVLHAFPKLYALETDYGSVIGGAIAGAWKRSRSTEHSRASAKMFSFDDGLEVLPRTICEAIASLGAFERACVSAA